MKLADEPGRVGERDADRGESHRSERRDERQRQLETKGEEPHAEAVEKPIEERDAEEHAEVLPVGEHAETRANADERSLDARGRAREKSIDERDSYGETRRALRPDHSRDEKDR